MDSASQVAEMKQLMFLRRIAEISEGDPARWVPTGILGEELGLSYEESLAITDALREQGLIRRGGGGRLEAPQGPRVHILPEGLSFLEKH
ncbi:MAG TPA: hypothetical protein VFE05_12575 [Longimicrobiaceae bacterium]|jgi:hypothetical protein|nr:hypothetical protein [Longimicrobiaceae bacterium]